MSDSGFVDVQFFLQLSLAVAVIGAGLWLVGGYQVNQQDDIAGQAERVVSEDARQQYQMWENAQLYGMLTGFAGLTMLIMAAPFALLGGTSD